MVRKGDAEESFSRSNSLHQYHCFFVIVQSFGRERQETKKSARRRRRSRKTNKSRTPHFQRTHQPHSLKNFSLLTRGFVPSSFSCLPFDLYFLFACSLIHPAALSPSLRTFDPLSPPLKQILQQTLTLSERRECGSDFHASTAAA